MSRFSIVLIGCCSCSQGLLSSERLQQTVVYGEDGRREYYEAADPLVQERFSRSSVALIANSYLEGSAPRISASAPTWSAKADVCPDEVFADQPAPAFCSGVLLDWDLVLTSGHCVRLLALADFSIAFGFYYTEPGKLAFDAGDQVRPVEILAEALDPAGAEPRLDFAWLRLERPLSSRFRPAPFYSMRPLLHENDPLVTIGAPGGVPLKVDSSGTIAEVRKQGDFFIARTDTSTGWSGGAAYDADMVLTGILSRGALDLIDSHEGCRVAVHPPAAAVAAEQFTYGAQALLALCKAEPSRAICAPDCGDICQAPAKLEVPAESRALVAAGGCSFSPRVQHGPFSVFVWVLVGACTARQAARRRLRLTRALQRLCSGARHGRH
jgi:hypothetical protein